MIYLRWGLYLIPSIIIELMCYILAPIVALFIRKEERTDRVKQIDNLQHTMAGKHTKGFLGCFMQIGLSAHDQIRNEEENQTLSHRY